MKRVLDLQRLATVAVSPVRGNSCTSSGSSCCNG